MKDGEVLVKPTRLSIDPAVRGWVRALQYHFLQGPHPSP